MKTRLKRALSLALTALMLLMLVPGAFASEIVTSEPVIPGLAVEKAAEPEKSAADMLYERLMACTTYADFDAIINALTEEETALLDELTAEQNAALEAKVAELGGYDVATLENRGSYTIEQGGSQTISISNMSSSGFSYTCDQEGITVAKVTSYLATTGYKVSVATSVPVETYELTVTYKTTSGYGWSSTTTENTDTISVTVTEKAAESAQVFYLKTPTSTPGSNDTGMWGRNIGNGTVKIPDDAAWTDTDNRNLYSPGEYVVSMPTGMIKQPDGSWLLPKNSTYSQDYTAIYNAYKTQLEKKHGVTLNSVADIEAIYLTPYKISRNNGSTPDKHIDCTISVKTAEVYTAKFWVISPDGSRTIVDTQTYKASEKITETSAVPNDSAGMYPSTTVVDGITYVFDGWYNEANKKITDAQWPYAPNDTELADGTVNFYAHYVKAEANLTIKKTLSGNMYNANAKFAFTVTYGDDKTETFELGNNGTSTISIPVGASVSITEETSGYTYSLTSVTPKTLTYTESEDDNGLSFTMPSEDVTVEINNDKTVTIDTGVMMDSLPYILILAVVVAVGVIVFIRKRRDRDDD